MNLNKDVMPPEDTQFKKGNRFNRGNPTGRGMRLRKAFTDEEVQSLGEEMINWVSKNNPLHLSHWYSIEKMITYNEWKVLIQYADFLPYYQLALSLVGKNYLDGTVNSSIAHRFIRVYYKDVKEEEDETVKLHAEIKNNSLQQQPQNYQFTINYDPSPELREKIKVLSEKVPTPSLEGPTSRD